MYSTFDSRPEERFPRLAGIIIHPTSFPSPFGVGDLGAEAYSFIDFLEMGNQHLWQILPLTPTGSASAYSPYKCYSAFAGEPLLIDLRQLVEINLLSPEDILHPPYADTTRIQYTETESWKLARLEKAFETFNHNPFEELHKEFDTFCSENYEWLEMYALYLALRVRHQGAPWYQWEKRYICPTPEIRRTLTLALQPEMIYHKFLQFLFFKQWFALKEYANAHNVKIIGDLPIFVHLDSSDVWQNQHLFQLDAQGNPTDVAGVPPDYFSKTGQLWGNPLYDWDTLRKENYKWWVERIEHQLSMHDYIRIDHFRGFESYWSIPASAKTAIEGVWEKGPGEELFTAVEKALGGKLPIIAEDLGLITPQVHELRDNLDLPGMKVLQFAFEDNEDEDGEEFESTFLPHRFTTTNCICYTGTHDNNTSLGWYMEASKKNQNKVKQYMNTNADAIHWDFIRTCLGSIASFALYPLQDVLGLGSDDRMNIPGTPTGNWGWRYKKDALTDDIASHLASLTKLFGRL